MATYLRGTFLVAVDKWDVSTATDGEQTSQTVQYHSPPPHTHSPPVTSSALLMHPGLRVIEVETTTNIEEPKWFIFRRRQSNYKEHSNTSSLEIARTHTNMTFWNVLEYDTVIVIKCNIEFSLSDLRLAKCITTYRIQSRKQEHNHALSGKEVWIHWHWRIYRQNYRPWLLHPNYAPDLRLLTLNKLRESEPLIYILTWPL